MFSFQAGVGYYSIISFLKKAQAVDFIRDRAFKGVGTCIQTIHLRMKIILRAELFYGVIYINYVAINDTYETKSTLAISL